jgi:FkbM family methyltransferase
MNQSLYKILQPKRITEVVDIGANPIDGEPPYKKMLMEGLCNLTGFEPQPKALASLIQNKGANERYLPYAIGDGQTHLLKICQGSGMTSLFEPDPVKLALFEVLAPFGEVLERVPIETIRLDDVTDISFLDFLKIDIQGGELAVFKAGKSKLNQTVAIQVEVSFITLYKDQPGFGEIDIELRSQGFIPHCFAGIKKWPIAPCIINNNPRQPLNQLLEADIVYVRDFTCPDLFDDEQLKHLALIAHHCYQSFDLVLYCIKLLENKNSVPVGTQKKYIDLLANGYL